MVEIIKALLTVAVALGVFLALLGGLYWVTTLLPEKWGDKGKVVVFVGPTVLLLMIGLVIPALRTIYFSFFDGERAKNFVGLRNYGYIFTNDAMRTVLRNNVLWVILGTFFSTAIGLTIARMADRMRGENIAKALIFLPTAVSLVGAGIVWKFVYATTLPNGKEIGLLNAIWMKLGGNPQKWLLDDPRNTLLLIVVMIWIQAGFSTVVFSAAIKGVPDSLLEAARIDGATEREVFYKIVIPSIRSTIVTVVTTTVIAVLKVFDIVRAMTGGNFKTSVLANEMYTKSFVEGQPGLGAALAVVLFAIVVPVVWVNTQNQRRNMEMSR